MISISDGNSLTPHRRNYILPSHRKDGLIEWMKEMLNHSFALNAKESYAETMLFFEELIEEHRHNPENSNLKSLVPTVGKIHTPLAMHQAFRSYDEKYSVSKRRMIPPSVNEIRHILNLAQVMSIGKNLRMISFDGDQTLYSDGGNFDAANSELALSLIRLLCHGVKVVMVTAAGYKVDAPKYEYRIQELLNRFVDEQMTAEQVSNFYVLGGECHYLLQCKLVATEVEMPLSPVNEEENEEAIEEPSRAMSPTTEISASRKTVAIFDTTDDDESPPPPPVASQPVLHHKITRTFITQRARLFPVPVTEWQADHLTGPKPFYWPQEEVNEILDTAEAMMHQTIAELKLRAKVLRKEKSVGVFPGGKEMCSVYPVGHGSRKLKQEALDEIVLRVMEAIREKQKRKKGGNSLPYCVFNGGKDAWIDVGNKSIGVAILQAFFELSPEQCLHVGDQFLTIGNDIAARDVSPCIWIINPKETGKVLQHVLRYKGIAPIMNDEDIAKRSMKEGKAAMFNVYSGESEENH
eukprot:gene7177-7748_t